MALLYDRALSSSTADRAITKRQSNSEGWRADAGNDSTASTLSN